MKRIFTLLTSMVLGLAVFAAAPKQKSTLSIKSVDQGDIRVIIDGKRFEPNHNTMMVSNIDAGYHDVKIYREKRGGFYSILGKRFELVYNTSLMVKPKTNLQITVDRNGRTTITEQKIKGNGRWDNRDDSWGYDEDDDFDYDRDGKWGDYDERVTTPNYSRAMSDRDFNQVLSSIQKEWFEGNKMKSAQHIINVNYFTSVQVRQLLTLFTFEDNKLSLAKQAYAKTVDQKNFLFTVSDALTFSTSKDELARYIRNFR